MIRFFLSLLLLVGLTAATSAPVTIPITVTLSGSNEEFVGPFASWSNVKTAFGAVGDGTTDDTVAIQNCLNALGVSTQTCYFPAGTYKISKTVALFNTVYVNLIGEDPATTTIAWYGDSTTTDATFTGVISSNVLTASCPCTGAIRVGQKIAWSGSPPAYVSAYGTGTGGAGTYSVYQAYTSAGFPASVSSQAMTTTDESMLYFNAAYSKVDRLTFDGRNNATVLVNEDWTSFAGSSFDEGIQYADDVFKNATLVGLRCGWAEGCADVAVLRSNFTNVGVGIFPYNQNALDVWVWYSTFSNNIEGIANYLPAQSIVGGSQFHVYNSSFSSSSTADISTANPGVFNIRNNFSSGSKQFICCAGAAGQDAYVIQGNTILNTTASPSIWVASEGPDIFIDNAILSAGGATAPVVSFSHAGYSGGQAFSMGNKFTISTATCGGAVQMLSTTSTTCHSIDDTVVSAGSINTTPPTLPGTPPNLGQAIFEASPAGSGSTCSYASPCSVQTAVTNAAASAAANPVVHIRPGDYSIAATITVPGSRRMQIIGDGGKSRLLNGGANPILNLTGPSLVTLREFQIDGSNNTVDGIEIDGVDASGSGGLVFMEGVIAACSTIGMNIASIDYTNVELHDTQNLPGSTSGGIVVTGGAHGGSVNSYLQFQDSCVSGPVTLAYKISGSAHVNVNGTWQESTGGGVANTPIDVTGSGVFNYVGGVTGFNTSVANTAAVHAFTGTAAFVGLNPENNCATVGGSCGTYANYAISGVSNSSANVLGLGIVGVSSSFWNDTTSPADTMELLIPSEYITNQLAEVNDSPPDHTFVVNTLNQMRTNQPVVPTARAVGQTDVRMYRVTVTNAANGINLVP